MTYQKYDLICCNIKLSIPVWRVKRFAAKLNIHAQLITVVFLRAIRLEAFIPRQR